MNEILAVFFWTVPLFVGLPWGWLYRRAQRLDAIAGLVVATAISSTIWLATVVLSAPDEVGPLIGMAWFQALIPHGAICAVLVFAVGAWFRARNA